MSVRCRHCGAINIDHNCEALLRPEKELKLIDWTTQNTAMWLVCLLGTLNFHFALTLLFIFGSICVDAWLQATVEDIKRHREIVDYDFYL